jgi:hypothetical protein
LTVKHHSKEDLMSFSLKSMVDGAVDVAEAVGDVVAPELSPVIDMAAGGAKSLVDNSSLGDGSGAVGSIGSGGDGSGGGVPVGMASDVAPTGGDGSGQAFSASGLDPNSAYSPSGAGGGGNASDFQFQKGLDNQDEAGLKQVQEEKVRHEIAKAAIQAAGS